MAASSLPVSGGLVTRDERQLSLLCRVCARLCALPVSQVVETMRPLPVRPVANTPDFVLGVSIIRGAPVPVVDAAGLVGGGNAAHPTRLVVLRVDDRQVALAVDAVLGTRAIGSESLRDVPSLLRDARREVVSSIGTLDAELLIFLEAVRILPDSVWDAVQASEGAA